MTNRNPIDELSAEMRARLRKITCRKLVPPMLVTLTEERFSRKGSLFETKFDGEQCLARKEELAVDQTSRRICRSILAD
jgi:hypothetical protein